MDPLEPSKKATSKRNCIQSKAGCNFLTVHLNESRFVYFQPDDAINLLESVNFNADTDSVEVLNVLEEILRRSYPKEENTQLNKVCGDLAAMYMSELCYFSFRHS